MTHYTVQCSCGSPLPVEASQAGESISCPQCGAKVELPSLRGLRRLADADQTAGSSAPQAARADEQGAPTGKWRTSELTTFLTGAALVLLSIAVLAFLMLIRTRIVSGITVDDDIEKSEELIDGLDVQLSYEMWKNFRDQGLGIQVTPFYAIEQRRLAVLHVLMAACGILLAGGIFLMIGTFWARGRAARTTLANAARES